MSSPSPVTYISFPDTGTPFDLLVFLIPASPSSNPNLKLRSFSLRINDAFNLLTYFLLGEIDIMEARGNGPSYPNQCVTFFFLSSVVLVGYSPVNCITDLFFLTQIGELITFAGL